MSATIWSATDELAQFNYEKKLVEGSDSKGTWSRGNGREAKGKRRSSRRLTR
jgi:hypothetical protein